MGKHRDYYIMLVLQLQGLSMEIGHMGASARFAGPPTLHKTIITFGLPEISR